MPRNGSGVYSADWVNASPNTTIESAKQNAMVADLVADANAARPVTAGGTGETTARLKDGTWRFQNTADTTKLLAFDLSGQTTALTRTQKTPNYNGTLASQAMGTAIASASSIDLGAASGSAVHITGTTTITALGTADAGIEKTAIFDGILTLTHNGTSLILPGAANIVTAAGDAAVFVSEGSGNWRCVRYQAAAWSSIILGTPAASTSGTTVDFTSIPPWAKRINIFLASVSLSGSSGFIVQLGDSGGIEATGYTGYSTQIVATPGVSGGAFSTAFIIATGSSAAFARSGKVVIDLMDASAFRWNMSATVNVDDQERVNISNGYKQLTATLDRVRIGSLNGVDTFDGGQINISYE